MKIAAIGSPARLEELHSILSTVGLTYTRLESTKNIHSLGYDCVFDLNFDDSLTGVDDYLLLPDETLLLLSGVKMQIQKDLPKKLWSKTLAINALGSFLKRTSLEYATLIEDFDETRLKQLGWTDAHRVDSRVGLASPRIVCMIINEAYFTVQEGTANQDDIDKGMKLGTAYPHGPFEWCNMIGVKDVYEVLDALFKDTSDERYKICSKLKTQYFESIAQ